MISTILVAIDGSSHSMRAADMAFEIAAALKAKAVLLNVAKPREIPDAMRKFAEAEKASRSRYEKHHRNHIRVRGALRSGHHLSGVL